MNLLRKNNFIVYLLIGLTLIATVKAYSIFIYTSRGIPLDIFPHNSFVWVKFERFTDWLIPNLMSTGNPYKTWPGISLGSGSGFLTFAILRITNFLPEYLFGINKSHYYLHVTFFFIFILDLILLYKIFHISLKKILGKLNQSVILLFFIIFVFLNYSIWMTIDRGNPDILAFTFILFLYYLNLKNCYKYDWLILTLIVCLKPSNCLLLLPIFFCRGKFIFFSLVLIIINYFLPLAVYHDLNISYLLRNIIEIRPLISGLTDFCNNLACGLRIFRGTSELLILGISLFFINILFIALIFVGSKKIRLNIIYGLFIFNFLIFILIKFDHQIINYYYAYSALLLVSCLLIRSSNFFETIRVEHRIFFLIFAILTTFIINDPSPDYKLPYLIPAIFYFNNYFISNKFNPNLNLLVLLSFILIFSFINIPIPGLGNYFTILRILGILTLYSIMLYNIFSVNFLKKNYY